MGAGRGGQTVGLEGSAGLGSWGPVRRGSSWPPELAPAPMPSLPQQGSMSQALSVATEGVSVWPGVGKCRIGCWLGGGQPIL